MRMLFEVQDLAVASPATVSRCGMVYLAPENLGWQPYVTSWIQRELYPAKDKEGKPFTAELAEYLMGLFSQTVERGLGFVRESSKTEMIPTVDAQLINSLCSTFVSLLADAKLDLAAENYLEPAKEAVANLYAFGLA